MPPLQRQNNFAQLLANMHNTPESSKNIYHDKKIPINKVKTKNKRKKRKKQENKKQEENNKKKGKWAKNVS